MATQSKTGRFGGATVRTNSVAITKWTCKIIKEFADSTDSGGYDAATTQTWGSQAPGVLRLEGSIEGNFDFSGTTDANFIQTFKSEGPYATVLAFDKSNNFANGNFDYTDVECAVEVPGSTMITFTANIKSNGVITLY